MKQIAIEVEGKEPSMKELKMVYDKARKNNIRTIFVQPQFSKRITQTIARELGAKVAIADPLSSNWAQNLLNFR